MMSTPLLSMSVREVSVGFMGNCEDKETPAWEYRARSKLQDEEKACRTKLSIETNTSSVSRHTVVRPNQTRDRDLIVESALYYDQGKESEGPMRFDEDI